MASVYYVKRSISPDPETKQPRARYHVRLEYGRGEKIVHLGVELTETLAKKRVRTVLDQLARGETPTKHAPEQPAESQGTLGDVGDRWLASRIDVADNTQQTFTSSLATIKARFGDHDPNAITRDDLQAWIHEMVAAPLMPGTIGLKVNHLAQIFRYGKVDPNPALDEDLRLPKEGAKRYRMPTRRELALIYKALPEKNVGIIHLIEDTGVRAHEACNLTWRDVDHKRGRVHIPTSKTQAGIRFIEQMDDLPVLPVRPDGISDEARVFPGLTPNSINKAMDWACIKAGIRVYSPHDLRHLHTSRLLHYGLLSPAQIAARLGHASPAITLSRYSHVLPPDDE